MARNADVKLKFDSNNANLGTERGRALLSESLKKLGAGRSIVCDRNGVVIGGNKTLEQAQKLGMDVEYVHTQGDKLIAVIRDDLDLTDNPKARELAYFDNRVAELDLNWSTDQLLTDIDLIGATGLWTTEELAGLQIVSPTEGTVGEPKDPEDTPELDEVEPRCKDGEIWQLGRHRLLCGSSIDEEQVQRLLGNCTIDFVWSDPPYGMKCQKKDGRIGSGNYEPNGKKFYKANPYALVIGDENTDTALNSFTLCDRLFKKAMQIWWGANHYGVPQSSCWIVWDKEIFEGLGFADAELAWTNSKTAVRIFKHRWCGMVRASENNGDKRVHPNQKPVALAEWCFDKYGKQCDTIFDPFLGSGMSILAAEKMEGNRAVYGCELSPQYCSVVIARWEKFTSSTATLLETL